MSYVLTEIDGPLAIITLNRPDKHNAFDDTFIAELTHHLEAVNLRLDVRVVVISASGKSFSAGADLNWMKRVAAYSHADNERDAMGLAKLMKTLHGMVKPTIARVHGPAFGGGVGLVACCDMAVGTHDAAFCLSEVKLGLIPAVISPYIIAAIGQRAARRYFLTAERFDAGEAFRLGLLTDIANSEDELDEKIERLINALLVAGPESIHEAKQLIGAVANRAIDDTLIADTAARIARVRVSAEGQEGLHAFLAKRDAAWVPPPLPPTNNPSDIN
ncbi:MAG: enoyl-CoA hydratase/isomerase family protein [Burkholderiales bacterium]|jgi:methylglutaconyl-CoA hydratase|nr:enoyl-CoA hydratase/isomerase family protein [Rhodocyclaceae bacterium]MCE2723143.1 enoyl-CoA hydratase/isomerase family protein [Betaproteobacteria bacterium]